MVRRSGREIAEFEGQEQEEQSDQKFPTREEEVQERADKENELAEERRLHMEKRISPERRAEVEAASKAQEV